MITFVRCNKTLFTCCRDCRVRKSRVPRSVMDKFPPRESGAQFYVPMIDHDVNEAGKHYITLTQQLEYIKLHRKDLACGKMKLEPDSDLTSEVEQCKVIKYIQTHHLLIKRCSVEELSDSFQEPG